jgi:hypothetical protein
VRNLVKRLKKLEVGHFDVAGSDPNQHIVELLRERRRRRLEASGQPFVDRPRWIEPISVPRLSAAETLRRCREQRVLEQAAELSRHTR